MALFLHGDRSAGKAREVMRAQYGNNLHAHDNLQPTQPMANERHTATFKSNFSFNQSGPHAARQEHDSKVVRDRQFKGNPLQPGATRQSYQDSDIFGTKGASEVVQKSAQHLKGVKERQSNTFARSNVLGNDQAALKMQDGSLHHPISTRTEDNWSSNVFSGPRQNPTNRKVLSKGDAGKVGLWGNDGGRDTYQKKTNLAGALSKKTSTKEMPKTSADERKMKELYGENAVRAVKKGDGALMTSMADWRNPQQTYTNKKDAVSATLGPSATNDFTAASRKDRRQQQLQSNVLTHADDDLREQRNAAWDNSNAPRVAMGSNASWNAQAGFSKPQNTGKVDAYQMKKNQLTSNVLEQTDYSQYMPMTKKSIDMNNYNHKPDGPHGSPHKKVQKELESASGNWLNTDTKGQIRKDYTDYNQKNMKQNEMQSSLDIHGYQPKKAEGTPAPVEKSNWQPDYKNDQVRKTQQAKQAFLSSNFAGHDSLKYHESSNLAKQEVIDIDVRGLPENFDQQSLKRVANVKHVVGAEVKEDNLKGICTGEGRIKIRLNEGETINQVRLNFVRAGFSVNVHQEDPRKRPNLTGPPKDGGDAKSLNAKDKKKHELTTKH